MLFKKNVVQYSYVFLFDRFINLFIYVLIDIQQSYYNYVVKFQYNLINMIVFFMIKNDYYFCEVINDCRNIKY